MRIIPPTEIKEMNMLKAAPHRKVPPLRRTRLLIEIIESLICKIYQDTNEIIKQIAKNKPPVFPRYLFTFSIAL